jgi:GNAT superfamily N-acetyltransferase
VHRCPVAVRLAAPENLPALLALWGELRDLGGRGTRATPTAVSASAEARVAAAVADPDRRVVLATLQDTPVGMAVFVPAPIGPLSDVRVVQVDYLVVTAGHRQRGVGRALLAAAAAYADEVGADQVMVSVHPGLRDANRFLARLGFTPLVVRRVAPVAALRRRLGTVEQHPTVLRDLVRRRRQRNRWIPVTRT